MDNTILNLYLKRVANGDKSYLERLCRTIGDRLVYLPVEHQIEQQTHPGTVKVRVPCVRHLLRSSSVPVFTSREHLVHWAQHNGHRNGAVSVLLADLCEAMDRGSNLHINPETEFSVELEPKYRRIIAQTV